MSVDGHPATASHRPVGSWLLLITPAPTRDGAGFGDERAPITAITRGVFEALGLLQPGGRPLLDRMQSQGLHHVELSGIPGDRPQRRVQAADVQANVHRAAALVTQHSPRVVIGAAESLRGLVDWVLALSSIPETPSRCLPFPAHKPLATQTVYRDWLARTLIQAARLSVPPALQPTPRLQPDSAGTHDP